MRLRPIRDNGLSIAFGLLFLAALIGRSIAGYADFAQRQHEHAAAVPG